ncbi:aldo/keto reductase [Novosphingobium album (ex Hu et al. 2023)]|uniref:Aldo/keto reductase n=1 Tax=Novosphingobium album (ex Hu et al. 2023) TaxID=2930093 RepID=A0ABT0AZP8_9SPHN|nr:aldo/keto reductase [Novosphingobium album (ex Hu et al. 2023)]MCJ2178279.1 aldo/keto reductase [Novosphingobium album (ex Hu et al. 2023)]
MAIQLDHYRLLGRSGLRVSPLALGTMTFGVGEGAWGSTEEEAQAMVDHFIDRGGNFIDTADFYGQMGGSEEWLGRLVKGRRHPLVISTKYSLTTQPGNPNASGNHRKNMVQSVEESLRRMQTDYIDLLYLHMWDFRTPVDEILRAFDDLVRTGKVLYIGLSDAPAWQASRMQAIAELRGWTQFCALQIQYSLVERTVEREMIPMAREMGMGVSPWAPLGQGVLTGKYTRADLGEGSMDDIGSRKAINAMTGKLNARNLDIADVVVDVAKEIGCTPAQVALAWTLVNPATCSPVVGVRTPAQLEDNLGALEITLTDEHIERLDAVSAVPKVFPMDVLTGPAEGMMFGNVTVAKRG